MLLYSTNNKNFAVGLEEAVFRSLPADKGLYMPVKIPVLPEDFFRKISRLSFQEIAFAVGGALLQDSVDEPSLKKIIDDAVNFPAPAVPLEKDVYVLELFHGPSMAFKDFGARFMSRLMAFFLQKRSREIHILVATSGDTGGAVALGFLDVPGIRVTILYPSGKVSPVQEQQMTMLGKNITALEVKGSFDDCQQLVKQAFLDKKLNERINLSSANSINISRLIPQTFYYFNAYAQMADPSLPLYFSVPSGNFGNLAAGLIAERMGLPVSKFIASTNVNDVVPEYLATGRFQPRASRQTLSNAMDVGNPNNFARLLDLFDHDLNRLREHVAGYGFTDEATKDAIRKVYEERGYVLCPHSAVAWLGLKAFLSGHPAGRFNGIFLSTAHPCKFPDVYEGGMKDQVHPPEESQRRSLTEKDKRSILMENDFQQLKEILLDQA